MYIKPITKIVTISSGADTSGAFEVRNYVIAGIILPAAFDGATITFLASDEEGGTYVPVYDSDGNQVSVAVSPSQAHGLSGAEADALAPWKFLKIVSGAAESADRTLKVALK